MTTDYPLLNELIRYFQSPGCEWEGGFRAGSFFSLLTFLVLFLGMLLLRWVLSRGRRVHRLTCSGPAGDYVVSAKAVADLLDSVGRGFRDIDVLKVILLRGKQGKCFVELHVNYHPAPGAETLPDLVSRLQASALSAVTDTFGITSVDAVTILVMHAKPRKSIF